MVSQIRKVKVFLSSPGDVSSERSIVKDVCDEINLDLGGTHNFAAELIRWETHARPTIDERSQSAINREIGDDYDIYLGIFGTRFGTPTGVFESGTEEEFRLAHEKSAKGHHIDFLFYFFSGSVESSRVDAEQLLKVQNFRKSLEPLGILYWYYANQVDFRINVQRHLSKAILSTLKQHQDGSLPNTTLPEPSPEWAFLPNYREFLDSEPIANATMLMEKSAIESNRSVKSLTIINDFINNLSKKTAMAGRIFNLVNSGQPYAVRKMPQTVEDLHEAHESYIRTLRQELPNLASSYSESLSNAQRSILIITESSMSDANFKTIVSGSLHPLRRAISSAKGSFLDLSRALSPIPLLGDRYDINRRSIIALHADLDNFMSSAITLIDDILQSIEGSLPSPPPSQAA